MKEDRIEQGRFTENAHGLGTVTRDMVRKRAEELALMDGRPGRVLGTDWNQAWRELTGQERLNPEPTPSEQLPEESRWEPVGESAGHRAETIPAPDEQTFAEQLTEEGVAEAEQDQMVEAARETRRRDRQE